MEYFTSYEIYQALVDCEKKFGNDLPLSAKKILGIAIELPESSLTEGYNGKGPTNF